MSSKVKEKKQSFYWKTATPQERAQKLLKEGDYKDSAQTDLKDPCCICGKKIKEGEPYRLFFNNNHWKGHEQCIMSGGRGVQQIRALSVTKGGERRIFWEQLNKKETAVMLLKFGVTYTARANSDGICSACGKHVKPGDTLLRNIKGNRIMHKEEAQRLKAEVEAQEIAAVRQAEKTVAAQTASQPKLSVVEETYEQMEAAVPLVAEQPSQVYAPKIVNMPTDVQALQLRVAELEAKLLKLEGFREAVIIMSGGKVQ